jgi:hypothetical protein
MMGNLLGCVSGFFKRTPNPTRTNDGVNATGANQGLSQNLPPDSRPQPQRLPSPSTSRPASSRANFERNLLNSAAPDAFPSDLGPAHAGQLAVEGSTRPAGARTTLEREQDAMWGAPKTQRVKEREKTQKAFRHSEWDSAVGVFKVHPNRIAIPCTGTVDESLKADLSKVFTDLKNEIDAYLVSTGKSSLQGMTRVERDALVKTTNPYKWITSKDMQIMIGESKIPAANNPDGAPNGKLDKMGHVTLIGGSENPEGRLGGLIYCTKNEAGEYKLHMDNDSGRFSTGEDRNRNQLENVANRLREFDFHVEVDWITDLDGNPAKEPPAITRE